MPSLTEELVSEILRDSHRYSPAIEPSRPTLNSTAPTLHRGLVRAKHRGRDLIERVAAGAGFTRRHIDPEAAAAALVKILALSTELERTAERLGDDESRRALLDILKLRVLGPYHAPLQVTPDRFRAMQAYVDRVMMRESATFEVADPWFSPISRYDVPVKGGTPVSLHAHSVDIVSVFLLDQYSYRCGAREVAVTPGDVVIDAGGCWGDTALYFAELAGPAGKVYTFEFDPQSLEIMRTNFALNPRLAPRIEIVEKALWDVSAETLAFTPAGRMTALVESGRVAGPATASITLDDFVADAGLSRIDFVKMDVEGSEAKVLTGARETLGRCTPKLALAAYHRDDDLVELRKSIEAATSAYRYFLHTSSPLEEETVLFARPPV